MSPKEGSSSVSLVDFLRKSGILHGIALGVTAARRRWVMTKYLSGVLTVIAVGTMLIAYGLLNGPLPAALAQSRMVPAALSQDDPASDRVTLVDSGRRTVPAARAYAARPYPVSYSSPATVAPRPVIVERQAEAPVRVVEREPRRDWKKTAMFIGGSSAAGAGLGAIFGGKKGALIGAALGGGASTIYEVTKK